MVKPGDADRASDGEGLPAVLVASLKGVIWRDEDPPLWQSLGSLQARVRDYVAVLGLELVLDDAEGYAYVRQKPREEGEPELPRLVARRPLSYPVSLLLVLLRRRLAEFDARGGETRLIVSVDEMVDLVRLYLPETKNEAKLFGKIETLARKVADLGFLRPLKGSTGQKAEQYEVRRILKAFVDAAWLTDFDARLAAYVAHAKATGSGIAGDEEAP